MRCLLFGWRVKFVYVQMNMDVYVWDLKGPVWLNKWCLILVPFSSPLSLVFVNQQEHLFIMCVHMCMHVVCISCIVE